MINKLKDRVDIQQVAKDLNMDLQSRGDSLVGNCPTGHPSKSGTCFSINKKGQFFHCFHCGIGSDVIGLVEMVLDVSFKESIKWLCDNYAAELKDEADKVVEEMKKPKEYFSKAALYEEIYKYGKDVLQQVNEIIIPHYNYLLNERGYTEETIEKSEWIFFPEEKYIRNYLRKRFSEANQQISDLSLQGACGDKFRLAFPYRDRFGMITGFIKRNTNSKDKDRYDSTKGLKKSDLFNLFRWRKRDDLVLLEGYPDALTMEAMGISGVVALGQAIFGKKLLEGLKHFGIRKITVSLDNDGVGIENTYKIVDLLLANNIKVYVIDPESLEKHKDPDEFIKANGIDKFKELIKNAESAITWKIRKIVDNRDRLTATGFDDTFIACVNFWETLTSSFERILARKAICRYLKILNEHFNDELKTILDKRIVKQQIETIEEVSTKAKLIAQTGKPNEALNCIKNGVEKLDAMVAVDKEESYISVLAHEEIKKMAIGFNTGYPTIDNYFKIPAGALTIIAGRPSHGKTTLLMNLMMMMIPYYPKKEFYFFSYEEARSQIYIKLINQSARVVLDKYSNIRELQAYVQSDAKDNETINTAIRLYDKLVVNRNLTVYDTSYDIDALIKKITWLAINRNLGCIFIDYIQKIRSKKKFFSRQLEIQDISNELLKVAKKYGIAIVLGCQLGRPAKGKESEIPRLSNLRESGDIENDANLVISILNKSMVAKESGHEADHKSEIDIELTVLKNRNGIVGLTIPMLFDRAISKIFDIIHKRN